MSEAEHKACKSSPTPVPPEMRDAPDIVVRGENIGELTSTPTPPLESAHSNFAEFHEGYVSRYIELADTKAAWIFAIASGLLAYIFSSHEIRMILLLPSWNSPFALISATVILLVLSGAFSFLVISPRFRTSGEGIVFFLAVAKKASADSFVREIASMSDAALTEARLKHSHDISRVCARKYAYLRLAFWSGVLALMGMLGIVLIT